MNSYVYSGNNEDYGNLLVIYHGSAKDGKGGLYTLFAHGDSLSVVVGDYVNAGDKIMESGKSGVKVSGPHLHYEIITSKRGPDAASGYFSKNDPRYTISEFRALLGGGNEVVFDNILVECFSCSICR